MAGYVLASIAYSLLLFEQWQLASRAGQSLDTIPLVLVQESLMALLVLAVAFAGTVKAAWRYLYAVAATVFASYAGLGMAARFSAALELVAPLEARGISVSDYEGTFYLVALAAAVSYLLTVLLLRRSYGKLLSVREGSLVQEIPS